MKPLYNTLSSLGRKFGSGITYILFDQFTTDRAAGAVNGTQAEPTGGVRTVVDTNGKLNISGGKLNFLTGGAGYSDPALWYPIQSRVGGKILFGDFYFSDYNVDFMFLGLDNNTSGLVTNGHSFYQSAGNLRVYDNTVSITGMGTISLTTNYFFAIIFRDNGAFYYIKGGIYTNWTLIYISSIINTSLYPTIQGKNASAFTADNIRIPTDLWLPTPLAYDTFSRYIAYDTFTRADGSIGSTETPSPVNQTLTPIAWNGGSVIGGKMVVTPVLGSELLTNGNMESGFTGGLANGWSTYGASTQSQESSVVHGGLYSQKVSGMNSAAGVTNWKTVPNNSWYNASVWARKESGGSLLVEVDSHGYPIIQSLTLTSGWQNLFVTFNSKSTNDWGFYLAGYTNAVGYIDDATLKPLTLSSLFSTIPTLNNNVIADVNLTLTSGTQAGIVLNLDSETNPANFVICYYNGTNIKLEKCVGGVYTTLIDVADSGTSKTLEIIKNGTSYSIYTSGVQKGATQTISDAGIISNTRHGCFSTYEGNTFDQFALFANNVAIGSTEPNSPDGFVTPAIPAPVLAWSGGSVINNKAVVVPSLGSDALLGYDFTSGWTNTTNATINNSTSFTMNNTGAGGLYKNVPFTSNLWYKFNTTGSITGSGGISFVNNSGGSSPLISSSFGLSSFRSSSGVTGQYLYIRDGGGTGDVINVLTMTANPLTLSSLFSSVTTLDKDILADTNIVMTAGTQAGLVTNLDSTSSPANFIIAYHNGTNVLLDKCVGGTYTNLINTAATYVASATLRVITYHSDANTLKVRVYYNNVLIGAEQTITDVGIISNTKHGLFSTYEGNTFDNFTLFARGSDGEYSALDQY